VVVVVVVMAAAAVVVFDGQHVVWMLSAFVCLVCSQSGGDGPAWVGIACVVVSTLALCVQVRFINGALDQ
jgi:hypothetical protein